MQTFQLLSTINWQQLAKVFWAIIDQCPSIPSLCIESISENPNFIRKKMATNGLSANEFKQVNQLNRNIEQWTNKCLHNSIKLKLIHQMLTNCLVNEIRKEKLKLRLKWWTKRFVHLSLINLILIFVLMHSEILADMMKTIGRISLIKVIGWLQSEKNWERKKFANFPFQALPASDWTRFHETGCFIQNPHYRHPSYKFDENLCHLCSDLRQVQTLADPQSSSSQTNLERLIQNHRPFVIVDGNKYLQTSPIKQWTLNKLIDFYRKNSQERDTCLFSSNLNAKNHLHYLDELVTLNESTFAFW